MKETNQKQPSSSLPLHEIYGDIQRITSIFYWFIGLVLASLFGGVIITFSAGDVLQAVQTGLGTLPVLASLFFVRKQKFELAAVFLAIVLITLITIIATNDLGVHHISVLGYPTVLIIASLVIRKRTMVMLTIYTILCVAWLVFGELLGAYTPAPLLHSVPGDFFSISLIIILTAVMVRLITESLFQTNRKLQNELGERKLTEEKNRQQTARAEALAAFSQLLTKANRDYHLVLDTVVQRCAELIGDGASVFLHSPEKDFLELVAVYNPNPEAIDVFRQEMLAHPIRVDEGAYKQVVTTRQPVLVPVVPIEKLIETASPERRAYYKKLPIHSMMLAPLHVQGELLGVIGLGRHVPHKSYTPEDLTFLQDIADRSALAMLNARLYNELQQKLAERETLIAELQEKNAELERFTYTVSHDLKSPLITINGFLGYLEKDVASGNMERVKRDTQRIQEAVNKMYNLLGDLLELSRIGRLMNPPQTISFNEVAKEALEIVHGQLEANHIAVELESNLPIVYGDRQRLTEVLQNLIENAIKFMGEQSNRRIEIGQRGEEDGKPVFFVKDNGIGIAPEYHNRIFGLFDKLDAKTEGTGIGLALVKRIVEFNGGRIWVESEAGKGATFCFTLPVPGPEKTTT